MTTSIKFKVHSAKVDKSDPQRLMTLATLFSTDYVPPVAFQIVSAFRMKEGEYWRLDFTKEETK